MGEILIDFFKDYGYWGMFFMAFLSGSIVPIASEVLLVFFLGIGLDALTLTTVATIGNTIGGVSCFFLGYLTNKERVRRLFRVSDKSMEKADRLIGKYGFWAAGLSFVPAVGEVILLVLGVMRADWLKVLVVMALGKFIRYAFITASYVGFSQLFG